MRTTGKNHRDRLAKAALDLSYRRGFGNSALSDIATAAGIPLGNLYYYFKTKDAIGGAILELRLSRLERLLTQFDQLASPGDRLCAFVDVKITNREALARLGCPVGTLCSELHKSGSPVAKQATWLFDRALCWMEKQFAAIGHKDEARGLALHLLSATQGVSLLAHAFHDPGLIMIESERLKKWIRSL